MRYIFIIVISVVMVFASSCKPTNGCTDKEAINYDITADNNDGSCKYCAYETKITSNNRVKYKGSTSSEPFFGDSILAFDMQVFSSGYNDLSCDNDGKLCSIAVKITNLTNLDVTVSSISADYSGNNSFFSFFNNGFSNENFFIPKKDTVYPQNMIINSSGCGVALDNEDFNFFVTYDFN
jgi:hypothetical protein